MIEISLSLIFASFIAGLLMFLAPCTLPLVPAYLAFISGVKPSATDSKEKKKHIQQKIRINAIAFVLGFSFVFIAFGVLSGFFGSFIGQFRVVLSQVGGLFVIVFGLMMLNIIRIAPLAKEYTVALPSSLTPGNPISASLIGVTFALGWTPCVGPVLASVLLLASTSTTAVSGGFLLAIFSLGLALPFLLVAFLYAWAGKLITKYAGVSSVISIIGGVFLIFIGALLLTGNFGLTVEYGYRIFNFLGYENLFNFL